jgi:16S rRNA (uracil1498-N3)-methyltransferase
MTHRRWIADEVRGTRAFLHGQNAAHLSRVLRAQVGQELEIATDGHLFLGRIAEISAAKVTIDLAQEIEATLVSGSQIHLYVAIFKFDRMEWAIEKATELGVSTVTPVIAQRTDLHLAKAAGKRVERWRKIAREAAQQSRRNDVPEIRSPVKLKQALNEPEGRRIVLSEYERDESLAALGRGKNNSQEIALAIGPEGGWTEEEISSFLANSWTPASLGKNILRTETAVIAALAVVEAILGTVE